MIRNVKNRAFDCAIREKFHKTWDLHTDEKVAKFCNIYLRRCAVTSLALQPFELLDVGAVAVKWLDDRSAFICKK